MVSETPFKDGFTPVTESGRNVPKQKQWHQSTRANSMDKWKVDRKSHPHRDTVGALEIQSEPGFDLQHDLNPLLGELEDEELWKEAQTKWDDEGLRDALIEAAAGVPVETCCCGLIPDDQQRIRDVVPFLNHHFVPRANRKLGKHGFEIDVFIWKWSNLQGKSETMIVLVRFFEKKAE